MADVVCLGEVLIDFVPSVTPTTLTEAPAFNKAPGGAPANVAVGLARLGVLTAFMGKVGDDPFGHFLVQTLAEAAVNVAPVRFSSEARTALAFVSLRADGEREFMFYRHPSADMLFEPDEVDANVIRGARLLHYGTISLISEPSRSATLHAIDLAREAGCIVSCDPNLRLALWPDRAAADEELRFLTGSDDPAAAREQLWHDGLELMVVTLGAAGCVYFTPDYDGVVVGFGVQAIDTTGAGDGFVADSCKACWRPGAASRRKRTCVRCAGRPTRSERSPRPSGVRSRRCPPTIGFTASSMRTPPTDGRNIGLVQESEIRASRRATA